MEKRGRGRPAGSGNTEFATRVCKRGHVGNWAERKEGQSPSCRGCQEIAQREWRVRQGMTLTTGTVRKALADLKIEQERLTNDLATIMMKIAIQEVKLAVEEMKEEVK